MGSTEPSLNKTMDRADLDSPRARKVCSELNALVAELGERDLHPSNWYGGLEVPDHLAGWERANRGLDYEPLPGAADDERFPWFLYWEIAWLVLNNRFRAGQRLLDLGGSSSLFSCYAASLGLEVITVDRDADLVAHGNELAATMGWNLTNVVADLNALDGADLAGKFDHVTSVCVFEHLPMSGRIAAGRQIRDLLTEGGSFSITIDYANPSRLAQIGSPEDVDGQFVAPVGLRVRGNRTLHDNGLRYLLHPYHHPRAHEEGWAQLSVEQGQIDRGEAAGSGGYTFAALFQVRG